jgi:hypothetical protein
MPRQCGYGKNESGVYPRMASAKWHNPERTVFRQRLRNFYPIASFFAKPVNFLNRQKPVKKIY